MTMRTGIGILKVLPVLAILAGLAACGREERKVDQTEFIKTMIRELEDENFRVRRCAAKALGKLGPVAESAIPALLRALEDEDCTVRETVQDALARICSEPKLAIAGGRR